MSKINYFEFVDSLPTSEARGPRNAYGLHSVADTKRSGEAIAIVAGYFMEPGTLAYRLRQFYRPGADRESLEAMAMLPSDGNRNLTKLANFHDRPQKLKEVFGISRHDAIKIAFEVNLSNGPAPINLIYYILSPRKVGFDQYAFFHSPTGDETTPLHLGQIVELLTRAEKEGFVVKRDGLEQAKQAVRKRYNFSGGKNLMRQNMAYFDESLRDELIELIFK